jgi:hypothetical protein
LEGDLFFQAPLIKEQIFAGSRDKASLVSRAPKEVHIAECSGLLMARTKNYLPLKDKLMNQIHRSRGDPPLKRETLPFNPENAPEEKFLSLRLFVP